ncbi:hypothetical protein CEXT_384761 [Caerostris extrusa]|uniref:Uncharacterized protein n=1 Tax=Caerostris extrusa TaxID=172846 RepID=A0AAV4RUZ3_CAEEX|nr:hypothetical protein CEXT_384761 [Caerostris extrusa]
MVELGTIKVPGPDRIQSERFFFRIRLCSRKFSLALNREKPRDVGFNLTAGPLLTNKRRNIATEQAIFGGRYEIQMFAIAFWCRHVLPHEEPNCFCQTICSIRKWIGSNPFLLFFSFCEINSLADK